MDRIPVFRDGQVTSLLERPAETPAAIAGLAVEAVGENRSCGWLVHQLNSEPSVNPLAVGIKVNAGVVRLAGEVDNVYAVLALRRIAATVPGVISIVDDLWMPCE
jgi:hypothetical protein